MILQTNGIQKKGGAAILLLDTIDFKAKKVARYKDKHFVMQKGIIYQQDMYFLIYMHPTKLHKAISKRPKREK